VVSGKARWSGHIKKRFKPEFPEEHIEKAVKAVMSTEMKLREAATVFGLNPSTLYYRVQKAKKKQEVGNVELSHNFHQNIHSARSSALMRRICYSTTSSHAQN
jgi:transposase-like protein